MTTFTVAFHMGAKAEWEALPRAEQLAIDGAIRKLQLFGPRLKYPHQSKVKGSRMIRELRPRAGRSAWRPLYVQTDAVSFLVAAIAPEAMRSKRGFSRALNLASRRIGEVT